MSKSNAEFKVKIPMCLACWSTEGTMRVIINPSSKIPEAVVVCSECGRRTRSWSGNRMVCDVNEFTEMQSDQSVSPFIPTSELADDYISGTIGIVHSVKVKD